MVEHHIMALTNDKRSVRRTSLLCYLFYLKKYIHASLEWYKKHRKDFTVVLPLLREKVPSMQNHCMNIVTNTINQANPGQTPVDVCDQPMFAPAKQIQWKYPEKSGNWSCLFGVFWTYWAYCGILRNHCYCCMTTLSQVVSYLSYLESANSLYVVSRLPPL